MDEFIKISPASRKILEILATLQPYEQVVITADGQGKFDTFWVKRESKVRIVGTVVEFTK